MDARPIALFGLLFTPLYFLALLSLSTLFKPSVKDYFMPGSIPRKPWLPTELTVIGWLHILLGFWLVLPLVVGIGLIQGHKKWVWALFTTESILACVVGFLLVLTGSSKMNVDATAGSGLLVFGYLLITLFFSTWLWLRRNDVRQAFKP